LELLEVEGQHPPAAAEQHLHEALLLQAEQGLAHRRAADAQPLAEFVLGTAVTGHQLELGDVALELLVDLVGPGAVHAGRHTGSAGTFESGGHVRRSSRARLRRAAPPAREAAAHWWPSSRRSLPGPAPCPASPP